MTRQRLWFIILLLAALVFSAQASSHARGHRGSRSRNADLDRRSGHHADHHLAHR